MKNIIKFSLIVIMVSSLFTSCFKEYLDPIPKTAISDLVAFDTKDRIIGQVRGIYSSFKSGQYLGGRYFVYNDIRSDDYLNLQTNGVTGLQTWNHTVTASANEVQNLWDAIYAAVNRVNLFLDGLETNKSKILDQKILTQDEFNQFKGEALALRAIAYHHLIQLYARPFKAGASNWGAVLRLTAAKSGADNSMPRATLQATYDQILLDLNTAETLLPTVTAGTANSATFITRVHKNTVIAFKTRVYLHMERWDNVITEANKIVPAAAPFVSAAGVAHALASTFPAIFTSPHSTAESILSMPMTAAELPGTQNGLAHYFSASPIGNNEYPIFAGSVVWSSAAFPSTDARKQLTNTSTVGGVVYTFIRKYPTGPSHTDWAPVLRYAEVLLNLAEAEVMKSGVNARAVALLNAVFLRSNPTATAFTTASFANADAFMSRLMLERNMEFLGEGIRNMDTMRKLAPHAAKTGVGAVPSTAPNYVWPIPQTELNTNLLIQPN